MLKLMLSSLKALLHQFSFELKEAFKKVFNNDLLNIYMNYLLKDVTVGLPDATAGFLSKYTQR